VIGSQLPACTKGTPRAKSPEQVFRQLTGVTMSTKKPGMYVRLQERHPAYIGAVEALGNAAANAGPLDAKTIQLVQLAAAAAERSEGGVHSHVRRALDCGAKPEEVVHTLIALTSTIGFPNVTAALSWADDVLQDKKA
jgi:4-carboxymuconolactone decarboxylase